MSYAPLEHAPMSVNNKQRNPGNMAKETASQKEIASKDGDGERSISKDEEKSIASKEQDVAKEKDAEK